MNRVCNELGNDGGVPACDLAGSLDGSLAASGADDIEGEAAHEGHVLGAVPPSQSRLIL
ncbi:hypothetical protein SAMN05421720_1401, partial [Rhodospira trueperi]